MGKPLKIFLFITGGIMGLWVLGRITNTLQFFSTPTTSNYPTIKQGQSFLASNLKRPNRFDFICYYATTPEFGKEIRVGRLCGLEGDKIEIKNGDLYVNDEPVDKKLSVAYRYALSINDLNKIKEIEDIDDYSIQVISEDTAITYLSDQIIA